VSNSYIASADETPIETDESYPDRAVLKFADGTTADTDLIIACDGVKSLLRKALYTKKGEDMSKQQEKYAEWIAWRGLIPSEAYQEAIGTPPVFSTMWLGLDRHILVSLMSPSMCLL
jgi:salicylate hydroxylase